MWATARFELWSISSTRRWSYVFYIAPLAWSVHYNAVKDERPKTDYRDPSTVNCPNTENRYTVPQLNLHRRTVNHCLLRIPMPKSRFFQCWIDILIRVLSVLHQIDILIWGVLTLWTSQSTWLPSTDFISNRLPLSEARYASVITMQVSASYMHLLSQCISSSSRISVILPMELSSQSSIYNFHTSIRPARNASDHVALLSFGHFFLQWLLLSYPRVVVVRDRQWFLSELCLSTPK